MNTLAARLEAARSEVRSLTLDQAVAEYTAFRSFDDLIKDSLNTGYVPSLYTKPRGKSKYHFRRAALAQRIANAYDWTMSQHGKNTLAFRGGDDPQPKGPPVKNPEIPVTRFSFI